MNPSATHCCDECESLTSNFYRQDPVTGRSSKVSLYCRLCWERLAALAQNKTAIERIDASQAAAGARLMPGAYQKRMPRTRMTARHLNGKPRKRRYAKKNQSPVPDG